MPNGAAYRRLRRTAPLGENVDVPEGDRPVYVLPGSSGDPRVIIYLHGMCGDITAADYFRDAVRAHGTLIALRGDTPCDAVDRFKWRDDASKIQARIRAAFKRVEFACAAAELGSSGKRCCSATRRAPTAPKKGGHALPFERYPRIVLGGAPMKASPQKLAHAKRVAFLGGELETTENMRAGFDALQSAGIASRFFTLDCAYHGYFGSNPEAQLSDVLDWVAAAAVTRSWSALTGASRPTPATCGNSPWQAGVRTSVDVADSARRDFRPDVCRRCQTHPLADRIGLHVTPQPSSSIHTGHRDLGIRVAARPTARATSAR